MDVRELTAEDLVAYQRLSTGAFGGRVEATGPRPFSPGQIPLGIDASVLPGGAPGVLAAGARIRRDRIALGGGEADCGGVGGLAVDPASRGRGLFRPLLEAVIARCAAEGMAFSMLYPSNPAIYRGLGYQVIAQADHLDLPLVDLQHLRPVPGRRTEAVTAVSFERVRTLYRELTADDNGPLRREPPLFPSELPGDGWSAVLLTDEDGADRGYVSWTRSVDGEGPLEVHELLGRDRADRLALLQVLGTWSTVVERARIRVRPEDPLLDVLPGGLARRDPAHLAHVMLRVIDTAAALAVRPAPAGLRGTLLLRVADATVPPGTARAAGTWRVEVADGRTTAVPLAAEDEGAEDGAAAHLPRAVLDVHAASLLLAGGRRLADAERLGLEVRADPAARSLLDALWAGPRPGVLDAF